MSVVMKCSEMLVIYHMHSLQGKPENAIATHLHMTLNHVEVPGTQVRMLFVAYSSAFNTISPDILLEKLIDLNISPSLCSWMRVTNCPQLVKLGQLHSYTLNPLLYGIYTYNCSCSHPSNCIIKFDNYTIGVSLIPGGDDSTDPTERRHRSLQTGAAVQQPGVEHHIDKIHGPGFQKAGRRPCPFHYQ